MKFMKNEEDAVSPVIGVILMVAITVILAAVIAAFVFGMSGGVTKTKNVAVTARQAGSLADPVIEVTLQGGADFDTLAVISGNVTPQGTSTNVACTSLAAADGELYVGAVMSCNGAANQFDGSDHLVVIGTFGDGTSQVLLDTYL
jgi:flagellin-like protein